MDKGELAKLQSVVEKNKVNGADSVNAKALELLVAEEENKKLDLAVLTKIAIASGLLEVNLSNPFASQVILRDLRYGYRQAFPLISKVVKTAKENTAYYYRLADAGIKMGDFGKTA